MLLRRDFYKDIKVCPVCKGYGILNPENSSRKFNYCDECEGYGVFVDEERGRIVFGLPTFVDYPARNLLKNLKISAYLILILIIIFSILIIF